MKTATLSVPELILIAGTRVALGTGIGFMLANKIDKCARKKAGWALIGIGALSTIPLAIDVFKKSR
ncbi:MAG TPA: hypothetical protein VFC63_27770 [Blastocatellia bacterium]|nr:hypothetical protein [Blastocatellia bacterium]